MNRSRGACGAGRRHTPAAQSIMRAMLGRRRRLVLGSVLVIVACACTPSPTKHDAPYVAGGQLHDPDGRVVILRGANLANAHKGSPYFGFHGPDDFVRLRRDLGMSSIRLLMTWAA